MGKEVRIAGERDVRATVDAPESGAAVVACPPHPQMGGDRTDPRLRAVGEALDRRAIACLRLDYGPWAEGRGERLDVRNAVAYARDHYEPVGLFGYSFGAGVALLVAADARPAALSVLAPPASLGEDETAPALDALDCPVQVLYGERDGTVDWDPVVARAGEGGHAVESFSSDHFFVGQYEKVAERAAAFLAEAL